MVLSENQKLLFNKFIHKYYYSNHQNAKKWDIKNDIFSANPNGIKRVIIDFDAIRDFDVNQKIELMPLLKSKNMKSIIEELTEEINFEADVDIEDPNQEYRYSFKKWNYPDPKNETDPTPYPHQTLKVGFNQSPNKIPLFETTNPKNWKKLVEVTSIIQNIGVPTVYSKSRTYECKKCGWQYSMEFNIFQKKVQFNSRQFCPYCLSQQQFKEKTEKEVVERVQLLGLGEEQVTSLPIMLKTILPEDLIDADPEKRKLLAGKKIKIVGILDAVELRTQIKKIPVIDVLYWKTLDDEIVLKKEDIKKIKRLSKRKKIIDLLVKSFSPSVYGYEKVKESLILSCVGGVTKIKSDKKLKRGSIHILLIGDPATAKSTLGTFIYNYIPKSRYAVCSEMTHAGLGVALLKDVDTESWMISAGVLPLAHNSIAVLDEIDKATPDDIKSLDVVMEMQTLPLDKAGISIKLPARTTILAIANPKMSRFDPFVDLKEQISLSEVNLSRYDLKWAFRDLPDKEKDRKICKRMLSTEIVKTPIPIELLIKYLMYAKELKPILSKATEKVIEKYYLDLREKSSGKGGVLQITPRQFDALIRLSEAYAKLRLADNTIKQDGENAINIFEQYLQSFGVNPETGEIEIDRAEGRSTTTTRSKYYVMKEIMEGLQKQMKKIPKKDFVEACSTDGFSSTEIERWIQQSMREGVIIEPRTGFFQMA